MANGLINTQKMEKCVNEVIFHSAVLKKKQQGKQQIAFFATGLSFGLIMYILTTFEFLNITLNFV